jgi:Tol biopolymer transport system component
VAAVEPPQFAGRSRSLVYASHCPEAFDNLYSVAPDGAALRRLTTVKAEETWPVASPDGSRIAFSWSQYTGLSCKGCPSSIRILGGRVLTSPQDAFDLSPSWSPDGKEILFSRSSATSPGELMVVPAGGGEARDLKLVGSGSAWGPSRIAFIDQLHSPPQLKTANPDGSGVRVVTSADVLAPPAWSADGRLAYLIRAGVVVVAADGRAAAPVKLPFERVQTIAWSPDGTHWVVVAQQRGQATTDVYTVRTDGTDVRRITRNVAVTSASWR